MIEWEAVREAASRFLPKHATAAGWKHRSLSHVEQEGLLPMPKDRGADHGDVDGLLECSQALGMVGAETRGRAAAQQASGGLLLELMTFEIFSTCRPHTQSGCTKLPTSSWVVLDNSPEPTTGGTLCQKNGGLADLLYMDNGGIVCHPILVPSHLHAFDDTPMRKWERNEHHRKRMSFTTWTVWVQHLLSGELMTCRTWPRSPQ